jgi:L-2-hydroxyglutarate oxidase
MWQEYAEKKKLLFKRDGVLEVALDDKGIARLHKYMEWGQANGLKNSELKLLDRDEVAEFEPNVRCASALYCSKDASVDYGSLSVALLKDLKSFGCTIALGTKVASVSPADGSYLIGTGHGNEISARYVVNAAGGNSMDIAHLMGVANEYTDIHFRGEYWESPQQYHDLTRLSVYSVPKHPEYPFLDPHWIVRADGRREVGPNAVPVFGPYAYGWPRNLADMVPKLVESSRTARRTVFDRKFLALATTELKSSLSKTAMINRVREFLPGLRAGAFKKRGTSGIRSSVIDSTGRFVPDTMVLWKDSSVHVLNYNSPGATGALPMAAKVAGKMISEGLISVRDKSLSLWDATAIAERLGE